MNYAAGIYFYLLSQPLLLFAVALAVLWPAYHFFTGKPAIPLSLLTSIAVFALTGTLALFATRYLLYPGFFDHIEPNTAIISQLLLRGEPVYHALDAAERYSFLYGPLAYFANALTFLLAGASDFTFKLTGLTALLVSITATLAAVRNTGGKFAPRCVVAIALFAGIALLFRNYSFWSKPDSIMTALVALGALSATLSNRKSGALLCGLALGLMVNTKLHGFAYFLPLLAWFLVRDGIKPVALTAAVSVAVALLPFAHPAVSLPNYIDWLANAGTHGISSKLVLALLQLGVFIAIPAALFAWQRRTLLPAADFWLIIAAAAAGFFIVVLVGAKPGSGVHHLLPYAPLVALLGSGVRVDEKTTVTVLTAFMLALTLKALTTGWYLIDVVSDNRKAVALQSDVAAIISAYPESSLQMGYGSGKSYPLTFARSALVYAGNPYLLDSAALMDMQYGGMAIPADTIAALTSDPQTVWLIPKGEAPFSRLNWYYRNDPEGYLFDQPFREAFLQEYALAGQSEYFDLYLPRNEAQ